MKVNTIISLHDSCNSFRKSMKSPIYHSVYYNHHKNTLKNKNNSQFTLCQDKSIIEIQGFPEP